MDASYKGNSASVKKSDSQSKIKNQESYKEKVRGTKTSHDSVSRSQIECEPYPEQDHEGFQFGGNPMNEDSFEKQLIMREKQERDLAREKYIMGIQGRDGGKKPFEYEHNIPN